MTYATPQDLGEYLPQVDVGEKNDLLVTVIARAEAAIDGVLGFSYAGYTSATVEAVHCVGGKYMQLPAHQIGTVTAVAEYDDTAVDSDYWTERSTGSLAGLDTYGNVLEWSPGYYKITANWGYGDAPAEVVEVLLEVATTIWQSRQSGKFSDVVGVSGGGAVGYEKALTQFQKMVLYNARDKQQSLPVVI